MRLPLPLLTLTLSLGLSCSPTRARPPSNPSPHTDAGQADQDAGQIDGSMGDDAGMVSGSPEGLELLDRLAGLWSGPATRTPLGDFTMVNVDLRAATDQFMFGRVDVDEQNALRFGFSVETHGGKDVLTYRNGGYFLGLQRDDRTVLVEHDASAETWRFCHVDCGCDYIDAVYDFEGDDRVVFDVMVMGQPHVYWDARRVETRALPAGFTDGLVTQGTGDGPFPPMPNLRTRVTWSQPLASEADIWVVLSVSECSLSGCNISRHIRTTAAAGATSAEIFLEQVHAGDYSILGVVDRNQNLEQTLSPDSGDGVSLPNAKVTIAPAGETSASVSIVVNLP